MEWVVFQSLDTPRDDKTGIDWLDRVLEIAAEITARDLQRILQPERKITIVNKDIQRQPNVGSV